MAKKIISILVIIYIFFSLSQPVLAGYSFHLFPAQGVFEVGEEFGVIFYIDADQPINAARAQFIYDNEFLELLSTSKQKSIFTYWPVEPKLTGARLVFEGGLPAPGWQGTNGQVLSQLFKVKKPGTTQIKFISGSLHANDGQGTNVLTAMTGATYTLTISGQNPPALPIGQANNLLAAPILSSPTHPDQTKWYQNKDLSIIWNLSSAPTAWYFAFDNNPETYPNSLLPADTSVFNQIISEDGLWYFHLRYLATSGASAVAHYRIGFDATPPEPFSIEVIKFDNSNQPTLRFETYDQTSGIDRYELKLDDKEVIFLPTGEFALEHPFTGNFTAQVTAIDKAGNSNQRSALIEFSPLTYASLDTIKILSPQFLPLSFWIVVYYVIVILLLFLFLLFLLLWFRRKKRQEEEKYNQEVGELAASVDFGFSTLRRDILSQIDEIWKKQKFYNLTDDEKIKMKKLETDLDIVETYIKKELKDVTEFDKK
jgi:hypothetical protein